MYISDLRYFLYDAGRVASDFDGPLGPSPAHDGAGRRNVEAPTTYRATTEGKIYQLLFYVNNKNKNLSFFYFFL